jgi:indolepyruvate ferredoxin oxidoreductase beta subunit
MIKEFNIVVSGIGGQGSLTSACLLASSAMHQGYDVKTSELHGLAQRYGHIPCHIRFGKSMYSSVILEGEAHLIIGLEPLEALRSCYYGSKASKTVFVIDSRKIQPLSVPVCGEYYPSMKEIQKELKNFGNKVFVVDGADKAMEMTGSHVSGNVYLLGFCFGKKLIPLKRELIFKSMEEVFPEKLRAINRKVFEAGEREGLHAKG